MLIRSIYQYIITQYIIISSLYITQYIIISSLYITQYIIISSCILLSILSYPPVYYSVYYHILSVVHGKQPLPTLDASEVQEVRKELVAIRDKVNTLLDALDGTPRGQGRIIVSLSGGRMGSESRTDKQTTPTAAPVTVSRPGMCSMCCDWLSC